MTISNKYILCHNKISCSVGIFNIILKVILKVYLSSNYISLCISAENDFDDDDDFEDFMEPPENFITPEEYDVDDLGLFPKNVKFPSSETLVDTYLSRLQLESDFVTTSTYEEYSHEAFSVLALYGKVSQMSCI